MKIYANEFLICIQAFHRCFVNTHVFMANTHTHKKETSRIHNVNQLVKNHIHNKKKTTKAKEGKHVEYTVPMQLKRMSACMISNRLHFSWKCELKETN